MGMGSVSIRYPRVVTQQQREAYTMESYIKGAHKICGPKVIDQVFTETM